MKPLFFAIALAASLSLPAHAGLVGHWTFDEGAGTTAADSSASAFDGTLTGPATWSASGRFGGALDVSGGGFVNMGDVLNLTGSFSVSAWVSTTATGGIVPVANHRSEVIAGYLLAIGNIRDGTGGNPGQVHFYKGYPTSPLSAATVNDGRWHLVTGVYDQTAGSMSTYVDGMSYGTNFGASLPAYSSSDFLVGGYTLPDGVTNANAFTGRIDDVRVFDHALSSAEVAALAVPEPGTYALMLAGLVLLGAYARRGRS